MLVEKDADGKTYASVQTISQSDLPEGDVTVAGDYSTLNYKDGLCLGSGDGSVRTYPHVPGIDFAGTVETSDDDRYKAGDNVILTGWLVGEVHWGGYSQKARVKADWLVPLPDGLTTRQAMAVGSAMMARVLGQLSYGASIASVGLAGGADLPASVIPFLLRGCEYSWYR